MTEAHSDMPEEMRVYGQRMYQLGQSNAYQTIGVMLAGLLAEVPVSQQDAEVLAVPKVKHSETVDWPIESLGIQNPTKRILKSHGINTVKDLTKYSMHDLMKFKGIAAGRAGGIDLLVRKQGITLREP